MVSVDERGNLETELIVSNLRVKYPSTRGFRIILEGVSFTLAKGKTLAIVGPNGGGKTTLLRALMGFTRYEGRVTWNREVRRIGYVPQALVATDIPISVEEFLRLKCRTHPSSCLDLVGLGVDVLKQRLGSLSGGELQRVLIAWAIVDNPNVLILDEPTSGVDIGAEEPIYQKVNALKKDLALTTLVITHNLHIVHHYSDYVLALDHRPLFFGETRKLTHAQLTRIVQGMEPDLSDHEHDLLGR
jgi:zinc transport system ATP-binding protein